MYDTASATFTIGTLEPSRSTEYIVVPASSVSEYAFPERTAVMTHGKTGDRSDLSFSRRRFMQQAAAAAGFTIVPRHVLGGQAGPAPSEKINVAGIGIGGVGRSFLQGCAAEATVRIAFLCDVDSHYAKPVFEEYPQAKQYRDYREMLDKESGIDAVLVARSNYKNIATGEWIAACRGGPKASCNFDVGSLLAEVVLLGNIAIRRGRKLTWDAAGMKFTNDEEANKYVQEPYRDGWRL